MSREKVLSAVRGALRVQPGDTKRTASAHAHASAEAGHPRPQIAQLAGPALRQRFCDQLTKKGCDVVELPTFAALPDAVAAYLKRHGLQGRIAAGMGVFEELPWPSAGIEIARGAAASDVLAGLSLATAGVAETGTLVVASSAANPVSIAFLADVHLVVVAAADLAPSLEDAMGLVKSLAGGLPRSVNLISGPSRTGDIGGRIVIGAHGPRRLGVFIVD